MKIVVTVREILDKGNWFEFCEIFGINEWAVNEGLIEDTEEFELTMEQAQTIGLLPEDWR